MSDAVIRAVVTDIEGTTTSISFVTEVLFPYARERMSAFIIENALQPEVSVEIANVRRHINDSGASLEKVALVLISWIDQDLKLTPLKALQGLIWQRGYEDGSIKGHLYPEVAAQLQSWKSAGIGLNVYSSGSETAQKLLFGYSEAGDLTPLFDHFFDTRIGAKREAASYKHIINTLQLPAAQILFLSDIVQELDAAALAGIRTIALDRQCICEGFGAHPFVHRFDQIDLGSAR